MDMHTATEDMASMEGMATTEDMVIMVRTADMATMPTAITETRRMIP